LHAHHATTEKLYRDAVAWVAEHAAQYMDDVDEVRQLTSVVLLAEVFGVGGAQISTDVLDLVEGSRREK
jgi:hypothetical protein